MLSFFAFDGPSRVPRTTWDATGPGTLGGVACAPTGTESATAPNTATDATTVMAVVFDFIRGPFTGGDRRRQVWPSPARTLVPCPTTRDDSRSTALITT